jgi:WD40 repeat protein
VATPSDLIHDTRMTPFNIGTRIDLTDFTASEAAPLAKGLASETGTEGESQALLERVLYWTGGHPYLTQRLCRAVAEGNAGNPKSKFQHPKSIDGYCEALFLSTSAREKDDNLIYVRERILRSDADLPALLDLYSRVRSSKRVAMDDTNPLIDLLRLSGIIRIAEDERPTTNDRRECPPPSALRRWLFVVGRSSSPRLQVRNRIYAQVFNREWLKASMPDAELRRQRSAFRRGLLRSAAVACAVVGVVGALALSAVRERDHARRLLYVADMNVALQAVSEKNLERAAELLDAHRPGEAGGADLRGFEWRYLWRLCQEDTVFTFPVNTQPRGVAYSPDGRLLAALDGDGTIFLWNNATKKLVRTLPTGLNQVGPGGWLAFSPDGKVLAAKNSGLSAGIHLLDISRRGALLAAFTIGAAPSHTGGSMAFSPDGRLLAAVGWGGAAATDRGNFALWDVTKKRRVGTFQTERPSWEVAFSPDGKTVAIGGWMGTGELWDVATRRRVRVLPAQKGWALALAFSPDDKTFATCGDDQTVRLWDRATWRVVATLRDLDRHEASRGGNPRLAFGPKGKKLATASDVSAVVTLWDTLGGKKIATLRGHKRGVESVAFAPDGATLATGSLDGSVKLWSATHTDEGAAFGKLGSEVLAVAFAPDSKTLATGDADGTVTLWNPASGPETAALRGHSGPVRSVAFSRDGKTLASGSSDRTVRLWDVTSHHTVVTLTGHKDHVWCVAFSPDGKALASGGEDGVVKLWDIATRQETATLPTGAGVVMSLSFSPDGRTLALGTDEDAVKLWDVAAKHEVASLPAHRGSVTTTTFSSDGKVLATGSRDGTVVLWDVAARQPLATLKGCKDRINSVAFSPDSKTLATGSSDTSVRLWNVATGREAGTLRGPHGPVSCVAFSPDGNALAAGAKDRAVRLWRADSFADTDVRQALAEPHRPSR